ncbi:hypothetical protein PIB30_113122, partial [Stylosanthes scabra]|nr:hypothetical protein [Stylosanthes scabra]
MTPSLYHQYLLPISISSSILEAEFTCLHTCTVKVFGFLNLGNGFPCPLPHLLLFFQNSETIIQFILLGVTGSLPMTSFSFLDTICPEKKKELSMTPEKVEDKYTYSQLTEINFDSITTISVPGVSKLANSTTAVLHLHLRRRGM